MRCLFPDTCRGIAHRSVFDPESGETRVEQVDLGEISCRVSYRRYPAGENAHGGVVMKQGIRLFLPRQRELPSGAWVEYGGRTYKHKGVDAVYPTHRECDLLLEEMA